MFCFPKAALLLQPALAVALLFAGLSFVDTPAHAQVQAQAQPPAKPLAPPSVPSSIDAARSGFDQQSVDRDRALARREFRHGS